MGDVTHIYTTDGTLVARYVYDAWGNHKIYDVNGGEVTKSMSAHIGNINPIRYRGYYYDSETELYYLEARYYDPDTGRFISQDEIDFILPNHLTGLNLYAYCNNNPVMYSDPSGNSAWSEFWNSTGGKILGTVLVVGAVVALTVATAGVGGAVAAALGGGTLAAVAGGAVGGAISGAIFSAGISTISQGLNNGYSSIDIGKVGVDTLMGAVSGAITGATFAAAGRALGLLGKTKWAQRPLNNWSRDSKNYMFGSKSGNFTFVRNGHKFRLESSIQHGLHYHYSTSKEKWKLIFAIGNQLAGLGASLGNQLK